MASIGKATIADRVDACLCLFKRLLPSDNNVAGASDNQGMDRKRDMIAALDPEFRHAGFCAIPTRQATEEHDQPQVLLNNDAADDDSPTLPPSSLSSSSDFLSSQWVVDPSADIAAAKACVS
ncbi:hypothetical protein HO133_000065 [Letharia lupina]|uniref:Uncharacterized protein n=1 Tax=Letharia lupina TaxID=560253 RepID=A0A8H6CGZ5_9LECA|nr:uncharacterized protein HO133_000065 [Letharia lupina]KAF6223223.1 hypothetical protein HO133_000065 [Letharia lupina]